MTGARKPGDPYTVGKYRPPTHSRWKPGQSGNPKGRPRKRPDFTAELAAVLSEKIAVTTGGGTERLTIRQALLMRLRDLCLKGDVRAQRIAQTILDALPARPSAPPVDVEQVRAKFSAIMAAISAAKEAQ